VLDKVWQVSRTGMEILRFGTDFSKMYASWSDSAEDESEEAREKDNALAHRAL